MCVVHQAMHSGIIFSLEIIVPLKILTFIFFGKIEIYLNESHDIVKFLHTPMVPKKNWHFIMNLTMTLIVYFQLALDQM
jgi:hypothetical protein